MPKLTVVTRDGTEILLNGEIGLSIMESIRAAGVDELLAICGGCCSCATCHIYLDVEGPVSLPQLSTEETELLESSGHRRANSRLSCQIPLHEALDGLKITIAPEE